MGKKTLIVIAGVLYVGVSLINASKENRTLARDISDVLDYSWKRENAAEYVEKEIREKAKEYDISLGPDAVKIQHSRTKVSDTGSHQFYWVMLSASVTYDYEIIPYVWSRELTIRKRSRYR